MNQDLNTVIDAALRLPLDQQQKLIERLSDRIGTIRNKKGDVTKYFGAFHSSDMRSGDNDKIDEDLAISYSDDHEPEN